MDEQFLDSDEKEPEFTKYEIYCQNIYSKEDYDVLGKAHNYNIVSQFSCVSCKKIIKENDNTCRNCGEYICNKCKNENKNKITCCENSDYCALYAKIKSSLRIIETPCFYCIKYTKVNIETTSHYNLLNLDSHIEECNYRNVKCTGCYQTMSYETFVSHLKVCDKIKLKCEFCDKYDTYEKIKKHESICENKYTLCKFCNEKVLIKKRNDHNFIKCIESVVTSLKSFTLNYDIKEEIKENIAREFEKTIEKIIVKLNTCNLNSNEYILHQSNSKSNLDNRKLFRNDLLSISNIQNFSYQNFDKITNSKLSDKKVTGFDLFNYSDNAVKIELNEFLEIYNYEINVLYLNTIEIKSVSNQFFYNTLSNNKKKSLLIEKQSHLIITLKTVQCIKEISYNMRSYDKNIAKDTINDEDISLFALVEEEYIQLGKLLINENKDTILQCNNNIYSKLVLINETENQYYLDCFNIITK